MLNLVLSIESEYRRISQIRERERERKTSDHPRGEGKQSANARGGNYSISAAGVDDSDKPAG